METTTDPITKLILTILTLSLLPMLLTTTLYLHRRRRRRLSHSESALNHLPPKGTHISSPLHNYTTSISSPPDTTSHSCYLKTDESKPQTSFKHVLADNSYNPFKHFEPNNQPRFPFQRFLFKSSNSHPYEKEIKNLLTNCSHVNDREFRFFNGQLDSKESHVWVDKEEQLVELNEVLGKERVFAVDTEQHCTRSFLGFTALLQISTRTEDYLVDTIALHDVMGILRPVFANPKILKVFHGADNDVIWLQRDFHIYVVNLFDTAKASELLLEWRRSLEFLLKRYCGVEKNKTLQLADWRLRPLSEELIHYARVDVHYLLYIADCMATEIKFQDTGNRECLDDKFRSVIDSSQSLTLRLYTKYIEASPGSSAALSIFSRYFNGQGDLLNSEIKDLIERLCMWRDIMARVHDESLSYVLSDQDIVDLASKARTVAAKAGLVLDSDIVGSLIPSQSPIVCSHLDDICDLLADETSNLRDVSVRVIKRHLGPSGSCPLSIYNYALLTKSHLKLTNDTSVKQKGFKASKWFSRKDSRQLFVQKFSCKTPVYHNCRIYASDGRLLCYCDRKKLEWYVSRDLAKLVDNDPPAIMLLFEPKGRPDDEDNDFYVQSKENMCVGCGEKNHYLRYRIIPSCYRMHFPEDLKSHRSHDIVLLCVDCHEIAHSAAEKYKKRIAAEFGIPLFVRKVADSRQTEVNPMRYEANVEEAGVSPSMLRTAASALLRHGPNMPTERKEELTQIVMKFYGGREISEEDLKRALLLGMSLRERRRIEKKRGSSFINSLEDFLSEKDNEKAAGITNSLQTAREGMDGKQEDENHRMEKDTSANYIHKCCDSEVKDNFFDGEDHKFRTTTISEKEKVLDTDKDLENRTLSDATSNFSHCGPNGDVSTTYNKKFSLLGHGPHGKQVVDNLLKEFGEEGIRNFCQRWRQVFVDSINPRYLPSGWDVMHRGRRDFGEYSVYNPLKKLQLLQLVD